MQEVNARIASGSYDRQWRGHIHSSKDSLQYDNKYRPQDLRVIPQQQLQQQHDLEQSHNDPGLRQPVAAGSSSTAVSWQTRLLVGSIIADEARRAVKEEAGFRSSAGIGCNKMLAKLASGLHKPDDQTVMPPTEAYVSAAGVGKQAVKQATKHHGCSCACLEHVPHMCMQHPKHQQCLVYIGLS